ncbi:unnamed protein product [Cylicocyclus nassatus]|uniref:Peptidase A1 domain-containing protein n=1 Tax=Cylicocyclus nassatus TaxID=53992 RepID=A0AA36H0W3_CYLNA|nr:unnamed protein product [Cylicocyclus nassatus]
MGNYALFTLLLFATNQVVQLDPAWQDPKQTAYRKLRSDAEGISLPLVTGPKGYLHKITLGSHRKTFNVMVSLRSSLLWIPNVNCKGSCENKNKFNSSASKTFVPDGREWTLKGYGGAINGVLGMDTIKDSNGKLAMSNGTFGMATNVSAEVDLPGADGVLGLAYKADSGTGIPFIMQLINGKVLDSNMFTIHLKQHSQNGEDAGSVIYGAEDSTNCMTNITYQRFSPMTTYQIQVKSITMGMFSYTQQFFMIPDTTPLISVPKPVADQIANSVGAKYIDGSYEIPCYKTIPSLQFNTEKAKYSISPEVLVVKMGNKCILALSSSSDAKWYFGAPLFKQYCVTFNLKKSNLGLASIKSGNFTTSSTRRSFNSTTPRNITHIASSSTRRFVNSTTPRNITVIPFSSTRVSNTTSLPVISTTKSVALVLHSYGVFTLICSLVNL